MNNMVKIKEIDENSSVLKKSKEMLKIPLVYEAFLMMMGADSYLKNMPVFKNKNSNHLDQMVSEVDKYADQNIQKLRYILKQNNQVRTQLVKLIAKECQMRDVSHYLFCLEENLGVELSERNIPKNPLKKVNFARRNIRSVDVQVKS